MFGLLENIRTRTFIFRVWEAQLQVHPAIHPAHCPGKTCVMTSQRLEGKARSRGLQRDVVYPADQQRPCNTSPNAGGWGELRISANEYSCAHHVTWSPNKLQRSTSIFSLWQEGTKPGITTEAKGQRTGPDHHLAEPNWGGGGGVDLYCDGGGCKRA